MFEDLIGSLECPECQQSLKLEVLDSNEKKALSCGTHSFSIVDGIPVLVRSTNPDFKPSFLDPTFRPAFGRLNRLLTPRWKHQSRNCFQAIIENLRSSDVKNPRVLVVGGGEIGIGMSDAIATPGIRWVETDIYRGTRTALICDGHELPFKTGSFDAVICQSVLEHVRVPQKVADELSRVAKPNALIFVQAAFMQQVHEGRADYFRFSPRALRLLFAPLAVKQWGASFGAATGLVWSFRYLLRTALYKVPGGRTCVYAVYCLLLWPAFGIDVLLSKRQSAMEAASELYFIFENRNLSTEEVESFPGSLSPT